MTPAEALADELEAFADEIRAGTVVVRHSFQWRRAMFSAPGLLRIEFDRPWNPPVDNAQRDR